VRRAVLNETRQSWNGDKRRVFRNFPEPGLLARCLDAAGIVSEIAVFGWSGGIVSLQGPMGRTPLMRTFKPHAINNQRERVVQAHPLGVDRLSERVPHGRIKRALENHRIVSITAGPPIQALVNWSTAGPEMAPAGTRKLT
jgi:hypothetical protein